MFYSFFCMGFWAVMLIVVGVLLLLTNLGVISAEIWNYWPILLIVVGGYIFTIKKRRKKIAVHQIFQKLATNDRVHDKLSKIVSTIDEIVEKKIDEWHDEATAKKEENSYEHHEHISGKPKVQL